MDIDQVLTVTEDTPYIQLSSLLKRKLPILLFGAGTLASKIGASILRENGELLFFADNDERKFGTTLLGREIISPARIESLTDPATVICIVAIWSPGHSFKKTKAILRELGVVNIFHASVFMQLHPDGLLPHYHFERPGYFIDHTAEIKTVIGLLDDEESKRQYLLHLNCRMTGNFDELPVPDTKNQYFPGDIVKLTDQEVFLDAGAYTGDTLLDFSNRTKGKFKKYLALEPDPGNFAKLQATADTFKEGMVEVFPFALGEYETTLSFNATGGEGAGIAASGSLLVECKKIDDHFLNYGPTFLKFDIEGAELGALKGGENTIRTYKPTIAVCLYHLPDDIWTIPLLLKSYNQDYKFYVRTHSLDGFEFVLYAIPG